ncbi:MAG: hypothetical protein ACOYJY_03350, partial [Acutalibacteraceae bacterium]
PCLYGVVFRAKPGNNRGIWEIYDGDTLLNTVDMYDGRPWQEVSVGEYALGNIAFSSTSHAIDLVWIGNNPAITNTTVHNLVADNFVLTPVQLWQSSRIEAENVSSNPTCDSGHGIINLENRKNSAGWSNNGFTFVNMKNTGSASNIPHVVVTSTLSVADAGVYGLALTAKNGTTRGVWDVYFDGTLLGQIDTYGTSNSMIDFNLGDVTFKSTSGTVTLVSVGMNPAATSFQFGLALDYYTLTSKTIFTSTKFEAENVHVSGTDVKTGRTDGSSNGGLCLITGGDKIGSTAVFRLTGLAAGTYTLAATTKNDGNRGIYTVSANGETVGDLDMYGSNGFVSSTVGTFTTDGGDVELTMVCTGRNSGNTTNNPARYTFALDYLTVTPEVATDADRVGQISTDGRGMIDIAITGGSATLTPTAATYGQNPWFAGWMVDGKWRADAALTLTADGSHTVTAYFPDESEDVMAFFGQYNETIAVKKVTSAAEVTAALQNTIAPALGGYGFTGWDLPEDQAQAQFEAGTTITATAVYEQTASATGYHLTVGAGVTAVDGMGDAVDGTTDLSFDQRITVTAEGDVAYWVLDGAKVGFGKSSYTFYVSGDNDIAVVLTADAEPIAPAVVLQKATLAPGSEKSTLTVIAQTSIPSGNSVSEYGVIFASKAATLTAIKNGESVSASAALTVKSSKTAANQQYMAHLVNVKPNKTRYAMAYAVVDGETIYSVGTAHFVTDGVTQPVIE